MKKVIQTLQAFAQALKTLHTSVQLFKEKPVEYDADIHLALRDSMIQRFKYCTHLFWEVLKMYLEHEMVHIPVPSTQENIREAVNIRFLSKDEGDLAMAMIDSRMKTPLAYDQKIAEELAKDIPDYYVLMHTILERLQKLVN